MTVTVLHSSHLTAAKEVTQPPPSYCGERGGYRNSVFSRTLKTLGPAPGISSQERQECACSPNFQACLFDSAYSPGPDRQTLNQF